MIETYMIMQIKHFHGFTEGSTWGGYKLNIFKKNLDFDKFRCMFPMQLQPIVMKYGMHVLQECLYLLFSFRGIIAFS